MCGFPSGSGLLCRFQPAVQLHKDLQKYMAWVADTVAMVTCSPGGVSRRNQLVLCRRTSAGPPISGGWMGSIRWDSQPAKKCTVEACLVSLDTSHPNGVRFGRSAPVWSDG